MSGRLTAMVCEAFARWEAGDYDSLLEYFLANSTDDVELRSRLGGIAGETYRGHDGVRAWLADIHENFERFTPWQEEVRDAPRGRVVAVGGISFRACESGVDMDVPWGWVYEFRGGKLSRMLFYGSPAEAFEAVEEPASVEVVRRFYDALNAGDLEGISALLDERVEYVNPDDATESGTRVGVPAVRQAFAGLQTSFEQYHCDIERITPLGDRVAVIERSTGTGRGSGLEFTEQHGHLFTLRADRIASFRWFRSAAALDRAIRDD